MKLWRKMAKKEHSDEWIATTNIHTGEVVGRDPVMRRNGRQIAYQMRMSEVISKQMKRSYPLLDELFKRAGMTYVLSKKQQETLAGMIEESQKQETVNETI